MNIITAKEARNISDQRQNQISDINKMLQEELTCAIMEEIEGTANIGKYDIHLTVDKYNSFIIDNIISHLKENGYCCEKYYIESKSLSGYFSRFIYNLYISWKEGK